MKRMSIADIEKHEYEYVGPLKKFRISELKKLTKKFKDIGCFYATRENGVYYRTELSFNRVDIFKQYRKLYKTETYVLTVFRGKLKNFDIFSKNLLIDERHEFHTIEQIIDYLDRKGYLKKEEWIATEKKK